MTVELPGTDIISWDGWKNYVVDYNRNRNAIEDYVRGTIQTICSGMVSNYGVITVRADEFDQTSFIDSFMDAVDSCLSKNLNSLSYSMESSLRNDKVTDMLLASIYRTMVENRDSIFNEGFEMEKMKAQIVRDVIYSDETVVMHEDLVYALIDRVKNADYPELTSIMSAYHTKVDEIYALYDSVMNSPKNQGSSVLKELVINSGKMVLRQSYVRDAVSVPGVTVE